MSNSRRLRRQMAKSTGKNPFTEFRDKVSKYADVELKIVGGAVFINLHSKLKDDDSAEARGPHGAN